MDYIEVKATVKKAKVTAGEPNSFPFLFGTENTLAIDRAGQCILHELEFPALSLSNCNIFI